MDSMFPRPMSINCWPSTAKDGKIISRAKAIISTPSAITCRRASKRSTSRWRIALRLSRGAIVARGHLSGVAVAGDGDGSFKPGESGKTGRPRRRDRRYSRLACFAGSLKFDYRLLAARVNTALFPPARRHSIAQTSNRQSDYRATRLWHDAAVLLGAAA